MRINLSWLRAHYPETFGIRKALQRIKVKRITRHMLSKSEIQICEENPLKKEEIITPYLKKWEKYLKPCIKFKGFQIPKWDELLSICKTAAAEESKMNYLSWDMAYGEQGWCVIEVNEVGQFIGPQMVYQRGIKKELDEYLKRMPKVI